MRLPAWFSVITRALLMLSLHRKTNASFVYSSACFSAQISCGYLLPTSISTWSCHAMLFLILLSVDGHQKLEGFKHSPNYVFNHLAESSIIFTPQLRWRPFLNIHRELLSWALKEPTGGMGGSLATSRTAQKKKSLKLENTEKLRNQKTNSVLWKFILSSFPATLLVHISYGFTRGFVPRISIRLGISKGWLWEPHTNVIYRPQL